MGLSKLLKKLNPVNLLKNYAVKKIIRTVFEQVPILKQINGYKTQILRHIQFAVAVLVLANQVYDFGFDIDEGAIAFGVARFFELIADIHAEDKEDRGLDPKTLIPKQNQND